MGLENRHLSTRISNTPNLYVCDTLTSKVFILAVILSRPWITTLFPSIHCDANVIFEINKKIKAINEYRRRIKNNLNDF